MLQLHLRCHPLPGHCSPKFVSPARLHFSYYCTGQSISHLTWNRKSYIEGHLLWNCWNPGAISYMPIWLRESLGSADIWYMFAGLSAGSHLSLSLIPMTIFSSLEIPFTPGRPETIWKSLALWVAFCHVPRNRQVYLKETLCNNKPD